MLFMFYLLGTNRSQLLQLSTSWSRVKCSVRTLGTIRSHNRTCMHATIFLESDLVRKYCDLVFTIKFAVLFCKLNKKLFVFVINRRYYVMTVFSMSLLLIVCQETPTEEANRKLTVRFLTILFDPSDKTSIFMWV